jgi:hypothetical protein
MLIVISEADDTPIDRCSEVKSLLAEELGTVLNRTTSTFCNPWPDSSGTCSEQIVKSAAAVNQNPRVKLLVKVLVNAGSGSCTPQEPTRRLRLLALVGGRMLP